MFDINWENLLEDLPIEDTEDLDLILIEKNIDQYTSQKLCEMIVCSRYLEMRQQISVLCMKELSNRRLLGDSFDYESKIAEIQKELPVIDVSTTVDIRNILSQAIGKKK